MFVDAGQAEAVTLTVAESFQIAKDILDKETSSSLSSTERPSTSASLFHQVSNMSIHCDNQGVCNSWKYWEFPGI